MHGSAAQYARIQSPDAALLKRRPDNLLSASES
jgi:hypothetical protein